MERVLHYLLPIATRCTVTTCPDPRQIAGYLAAVHPDVFIAVPRVWEKLKAGIEARSRTSRRAPRRAQPALGAALQRVRLRQARGPCRGTRGGGRGR